MLYDNGTYELRKKEILKFIKLMQFLEDKEKDIDVDGISAFDKFFNRDTGIEITYQTMINILKSNFSLMLYNFIEYTVTSLIESIYDEIKQKHLSYMDVNNSIRTLWRKTMLKTMNDPSSNFNTLINKNKEIVEKILKRDTLLINIKKSFPAGNLNGEVIKTIWEEHGIDFPVDFYRPDILRMIKERRNSLAHGTISFVDAVRDSSIKDMLDITEYVIRFLGKLIENIGEYIINEKYKEKSS